MLEISNNSTSIFRACQRRYAWNYIEGLKPIRKPHALTLGGILHEAFNQYYLKVDPDDILKYIMTTMDEEISKAGPHEAEDFLIVKYTLVAMWTSFPFKLDGFVDILPEMEFRVPVPGMKDVVYVGKVDGLIIDQQDRTWIRELKSTSQAFSLFETRVKQSPQGTGYIWALRKLGHQVQGMIYDYTKKPLLRKGVNEDVATFGMRIIQDYKQRPDIYYKRHYSYRSDEELALFEEDLKSVAQDIQQRIKDNRWHRNQEQCWSYNSECPYLRICFKKEPDPLTISLFYEQKTSINKGAPSDNVGKTS